MAVIQVVLNLHAAVRAIRHAMARLHLPDVQAVRQVVLQVALAHAEVGAHLDVPVLVAAAVLQVVQVHVVAVAHLVAPVLVVVDVPRDALVHAEVDVPRIVRATAKIVVADAAALAPVTVKPLVLDVRDRVVAPVEQDATPVVNLRVRDTVSVAANNTVPS